MYPAAPVAPAAPAAPATHRNPKAVSEARARARAVPARAPDSGHKKSAPPVRAGPVMAAGRIWLEAAMGRLGDVDDAAYSDRERMRQKKQPNQLSTLLAQ